MKQTNNVPSATSTCAKTWLTISILLYCVTNSISAATVPENSVFPRQTIVPVPVATAAVDQPVKLLNGQWKMIAGPQGEFWADSVDLSSWRDVQVPAAGRGGGGQRQGQQGPTTFAYRTTTAIPSDFAGKRAILRFDGVSNAAKVWVNGHFVREHWGSFMPWTCDITDHVEPGKEATITVGVDDSRVGLALYVRAGGIQRDVKLVAVPPDYLTRFQVETDLDGQYRDATLKIWLAMSFHTGDRGQVQLTLRDQHGNAIALKPGVVDLTRETPEIITEIPVTNPLKWDAEHPNLYTLEAGIVEQGQVVQTFSRQIGFIKRERVGRRLLVNGNEVNFRGLWGGDDPKTMADANINHTRQKWATEPFLNECDRVGIYVTDENPVDFAKSVVADDPQFQSQYLSLIADLIERDRSHPCVVMWGLCNESDYGRNVLPTFRYVQAEDPRRTAMFSWSHRVPDTDELPYDVYSYHYPSADTDLTAYGNAPFNSASLVLHRQPQPEIPILADEYAHLPIYNPDELRRDPGVHNFWGESIKLHWERMFTTSGALGGDIFGLRPNDFRLNKPEVWLTKKAYSPVRIDDKPLANPGAGRPLDVSIKNWFDHANLNELTIQWSVGTDMGTMAGPNIAPHTVGTLRLPGRRWKDGDTVNLKVRRANMLVDEFNLAINPAKFTLPTARGPAPEIREDKDTIAVNGKEFSLVFSKQTGLIARGTYKGTNLIKSGPYLHIVATDQGKSTQLPPWSLKHISAKRERNEAVVRVDGTHGPAPVEFELRVDGQGLITTKYSLQESPIASPATHPRPWNGSHYGGFSEAGVAFELTGDVDRLAWHRKGLWSGYPSDHIGRNRGVASRQPKPSEPRTWAEMEGDGGSGFGARNPNPTTASGIGANDFRSMKEYIYDATAIVSGKKIGFEALSDAKDAVRLEVIDPEPTNAVRMIINNEWNYPQLGNGNYMKPPILIKSGYTNTVRLRFADSATTE